MRRFLSVFAAMLLVTTFHAFPQSFLLMGVTNQLWKYNQTEAFVDTAWTAPSYNDSAWPSGYSVLGFEPSQPAVSFIRTPLIAPNAAGGRLTYYFRTTFTVPANVDPSTLILTSSNFLDDGAVFYLNGREVMRWNVVGNSSAPSTYDTPHIAANPSPCTDAQRCALLLTNAGAFLQPGVNLMAVELKGGGTGSADVTWGTDLHASVAHAPIITQQPVRTNIVGGRSGTLRVTADASPPPAYQWKNLVRGDIPGATGPSYTISFMDSSQAGDYYVTVSNPYGSMDSDVAHVGYIDPGPLIFLGATGDPLYPTTVSLNFDRSVTGALDTYFYVLDRADGEAGPGIMAVAYNANSNAVILTLSGPLDPTVKYIVSIFAFPSLQDYFGNALPDGTSASIIMPTVFRDGTFGYTGTRDTEIHSGGPCPEICIDPGPDPPTMTVDQDDAGVAQGLLRFDEIFGSGANQIPFGSIINKATLRLYTTDPGDPVRMLRMRVPWDETSTWNSLGNGIDQTNDVSGEAFPQEALIDALPNNSYDDIDVTASVQAWSNFEPNYGWGFISTGGNGWDFATSENGTEAFRPALIVHYTAVEGCLGIFSHPTSVTVPEGQAFTLRVLAGGANLTYQWFRNNVAIPGATSYSYTAIAVPNVCVGGNAGTYRVEVYSRSGPPCISQNATVTVHADTTRPTLISARGHPDQITITAVFSEPVDAASAQSTASYSLEPALAINSAVVAADGRTVALTTAPRIAGTSYSFTVSNVRDLSCAANVIATTTIATLEQHVRILTFDSVWKYDNSGCDIGTAWKESAFDDSAWPSASAVIGWETTATTFTSLFNQGLNTNNMTLLRRTNTVGCGMNGTNIADYFRTTMNIPFSVAGAVIHIRHVTDDGAVFYFNGTEVGRFNMSNAPVAINYLSTALSAPTEGMVRQLDVSAAPLVTGNNIFAVEVHQDAVGSSDVNWAAEVLAIYGAVRPSLRIVDNGGSATGTITISWDPNAGILQQRDSLTSGSWTDTPGTGNPRTILKSTAARFYTLRQ